MIRHIRNDALVAMDCSSPVNLRLHSPDVELTNNATAYWDESEELVGVVVHNSGCNVVFSIDACCSKKNAVDANAICIFG